MTAAEQYADAIRVLGEMRGVVEAAQIEEPWTVDEPDFIPEINAWVRNIEPMVAGGVYDYDAQLIVTAVNALGPLLDLAESVLGRHAPFESYYFTDENMRACSGCSDYDERNEHSWPCPDARPVLGALGIGNDETEETE